MLEHHIDEIVTMRRKGWTMQAIAAHFSVSHVSVSRLLSRRQIATPRVLPVPYKWTGDRISRLMSIPLSDAVKEFGLKRKSLMEMKSRFKRLRSAR